MPNPSIPLRSDASPTAPRDPCFFGYGSLVNRATHAYPDATPARVSGWRRLWVHTPARDLAFLSVRPSPGCQIDGLIAVVPGGDWAALDAREYAYLRHPVPTSATHHDRGHTLDLSLYAVPEPEGTAPTPRHPILLSYLDVVVQGFLREFGEPGVSRFVATTDGWDAPILNDRTSPRYPRAQSLTRQETALVDATLRTIGARFLTT